MTLFAIVDPWYVAACTVVPIVWGAVVHLLFVVGQRRSSATTESSCAASDPEAEEPNLP